MAIANPKKTAGPDPVRETGPLSRGERWIRFGSNVALAVVLATVLVVAAVWLSDALLRGTVRSDWTASGRFSLSPRTLAIFRELKDDLRMDLVQSDPDRYIYTSHEAYETDKEHFQRLQDLLGEYAMASRRVEVVHTDPNNLTEAETLLADLRTYYREQEDKKQDYVALASDLRDDLDALVEQDIEAIRSFIGAQNLTSNVIQRLSTAGQQLSYLSAKARMKMLGEAMGIPVQPKEEELSFDEARRLVDAAAENLGEFPRFYQNLTRIADQTGAALPENLRAFLLESPDRYDPLRQQAAELKEKAESLSGPEFQAFEEAKEAMRAGAAVIIRRMPPEGEARTPDDLRVVAQNDLWTANPDDDRSNQPPRLFVGEQAVSSAILGLLHKEKPAVLFVTARAPAATWGGPFTGLAERLRRANFLVTDWDVIQSPEMPQLEHMTFPVLVFVPPLAPSPQQPLRRPISPENYAAAIEAVRNGTPAILLAEPPAPFGASAPYADLFKIFGLDVRFEAIAVHSVPVDARGTEKAAPQIEISQYPQTAITAPLGALPTLLWTALPVMPEAVPPAGIRIEPILLLPTGEDYWADTVAHQAMRGEATRDPVDDLIPTPEHPVVLAVAVTRELPAASDAEPSSDSPETQKKIQKVVCFGDSDFAQDYIPDIRFGRRMPRDAVSPGAAELFLNSLLWVAGTEHLITVSPEALQARRISDLGDWTLPLRILLIGGLPLAIGIIGLVVTILRRR